MEGVRVGDGVSYTQLQQRYMLKIGWQAIGILSARNFLSRLVFLMAFIMRTLNSKRRIRNKSTILVNIILTRKCALGRIKPLKYICFGQNIARLLQILVCSMTTLEPKSTTPLSQSILIKPDRNGQISCEIVSNIGQTLIQKLYICQRKTAEQGNLCIEIRKKS